MGDMGERGVAVVEVCPGGAEMIAEPFKKILEPLYGSQEEALRKINEGVDRRTFVVVQGGEAKGVLCYKTAPSDEYQEQGVADSIEIKSLFLFYPKEDAGKGLGSKLWEALTSKSADHPAAVRYHVTVSEDKKDSLAFFKKKGFEAADDMHGKYHADKTEHLLSRKIAHSVRHQTQA